MPLYDYKCPKCGHRFEVLKTISERENAVCEKCGSKVERIYQGKCAFGAVKGSAGCSGHCAGCAGCGSH
ncbi:MAG: zinc ribbon domain-containing protein [Clostridiales bacterium]|nr:zinc ribbon domain-containing protein [Clostridiales bacterium]